MPLFFFASGLFAGAAMKLPIAKFLSRKAGNMFYLFAVWLFAN